MNLDWDDEPAPDLIPMFPKSGRYHVDLCEDPDCDRDDHVDVKRLFGEDR